MSSVRRSSVKLQDRDLSLIAASRPERMREMRSLTVPKGNLDGMQKVMKGKLQDPKKLRSTKDDDIIQSVVLQPSLENDEENREYHEVYKPNQKFLVPDSTLKEMERIVNSVIKPRRSFRYKDESSSMFPGSILPEKLDTILEKIDDLGDESDISLASSTDTFASVKDVEPEETKLEDQKEPEAIEVDEEQEPEEIPPEEEPKLEDIEQEPEGIVPESEEIEPEEPVEEEPEGRLDELESEHEPRSFEMLADEEPQSAEPHVEELPVDLLKTLPLDTISLRSDAGRKRRLHFRIFGNYHDPQNPLFKIQKFENDMTDETEKTKKGVHKYHSVYTGKKAHVEISAKLYEKPSEGFLNKYFHSNLPAPVEAFNIGDTAFSSSKKGSEYEFSVSGEYMNRTEPKTFMPKLTINIKKKGKNTENISKQQLVFS